MNPMRKAAPGLLFSWTGLLFLVVKHAVTVAFKVGVGDLVPEFEAHALVFRRSRQPARTVTARALQALLDILYDLRVFIETNLHILQTSVPFYSICVRRAAPFRRPDTGGNGMYGDCHIHMVLDGVYYRDAIDAHRTGVRDDLIRQRLDAYARAGVIYLRDGGDAFGVCNRARALAAEYGIEYRIPCFPICMKGRYGQFIGRSFETLADYRALVAEVAGSGGDCIKLMLSGLMDFDRFGVVTGEPLPAHQIREMIRIAHGEGFSVMAHVNGAQAIMDALEGGVDSVEHGAYMDAETVTAMAQSNAVWVPTLSTVGNLIGVGRYSDEALQCILDNQINNIAECARQGGSIALGSDAGAYRVFHASAVMDEYALLRRALADGTDAVLAAGEARIRRRFRRDC